MNKILRYQTPKDVVKLYDFVGDKQDKVQVQRRPLKSQQRSLGALAKCYLRESNSNFGRIQAILKSNQHYLTFCSGQAETNSGCVT